MEICFGFQPAPTHSKWRWYHGAGDKESPIAYGEAPSSCPICLFVEAPETQIEGCVVRLLICPPALQFGWSQFESLTLFASIAISRECVVTQARTWSPPVFHRTSTTFIFCLSEVARCHCWTWRYRWLWLPCGCGELNLGPPQEQLFFLTTELPFQLLNMSLCVTISQIDIRMPKIYSIADLKPMTCWCRD